MEQRIADSKVAEALSRASFMAKMFARIAEAEAKVDALESQWYRAVAEFLEDGLEPIREDIAKDGVPLRYEPSRLTEAFRQILEKNGLYKAVRPSGKRGQVFDKKYLPRQ